MPDELVLKKVSPKELEAYQLYLFKFQGKFWVVGMAFRVAGLGWKFSDELADVILYELAEASEIYALPRRVYEVPHTPATADIPPDPEDRGPGIV